MTTDKTREPGFPLPAPGYGTPDVFTLKLWAGYDKSARLSNEDLRRVKAAWIAEMQAAGWLLVWADPATGEIANLP